MDVIDRLNSLKEKNGWTDYRISKECNLSGSTVTNVFTRGSVPHVDTLEAICKGFGITMSQFFYEGEETIVVTKEQKEMFDRWFSMPAEKKKLVEDFINLCSKI